jgi:hypothetical protein
VTDQEFVFGILALAGKGRPEESAHHAQYELAETIRLAWLQAKCARGFKGVVGTICIAVLLKVYVMNYGQASNYS